MSFAVKFQKIKNRLLNVLFWSVVSAAFIGPGTITTATKAGALFQYDLLWALMFSTFACLLLQEASARVRIASGFNLGQAIAKQFDGKSTKTLVLILIIGAIILGCAAYETGNILGAAAGLQLVFKDISSRYFVLGMGIFAAIALSLPSLHQIAKFMGVIVMLMGMAFVTTAVMLHPPIVEIMKGSFIPTMPDGDGAGLLILGLIGTTVVPYDLFLGSGVLEKSQTINDMRFGLSVAVILGGIISMAVLTVGTAITGEFSYDALAETLVSRVGEWAVYVFAFGMFAAGFSSAITSPLASAITAQSLFEKTSPTKWKTQSFYFKTVWGGVLLIGLIFGMAQVKPIPVIILAQALNGLILPFISIFLLFVVNDPKLMKEKVNGLASNILLGIVVCITLILGMINVTKALNAAWELALHAGITSFLVISFAAILVTIWLLTRVYLARKIK